MTVEITIIIPHCKFKEQRKFETKAFTNNCKPLGVFCF